MENMKRATLSGLLACTLCACSTLSEMHDHDSPMHAATVPRHYHPGEEFVYMIEGSAVLVEEGKPDRILEAGDSYVIPPRAVHAPRGGSDGARAVVFRVHVAGKPERILTDQ